MCSIAKIKKKKRVKTRIKLPKNKYEIDGLSSETESKKRLRNLFVFAVLR